MAHPTGELATSRACAKKGVNMGISSFANYGIDEIRSAGLDVGSIAHGMQMYTMQDRALQERILRQADAAGCSAILLTADSPVLGVRYNEWRNDFRTPEGLGFPIIERSSELIRSQTHDSGFMAFNSDQHSWAKEIPWLRSITKMEIWIKGVLTAEDVLLAVEYGCDGVIVSNHGGRQLDGVPATLDVLPECVAAANGKIRIHVDGGIRSGTDIFKCLALGAECCWVGRPAIWGLAVSKLSTISYFPLFHPTLKHLHFVLILSLLCSHTPFTLLSICTAKVNSEWRSLLRARTFEGKKNIGNNISHSSLFQRKAIFIL